MLLSPQSFRMEVSGRVCAQPVRRCITHLLPVRLTYVGRTNLTSQGAPKRVRFGEPCDRERIFRPSSYQATPRGSTPGVARFYAPFRDFICYSTNDLGLSPVPVRRISSTPTTTVPAIYAWTFCRKLSLSLAHGRDAELTQRTTTPTASGPFLALFVSKNALSDARQNRWDRKRMIANT
jgi:hypothetical protein